MHILKLALCGGDSGGGGIYVFMEGACSDAGCMQMCWQAI